VSIAILKVAKLLPVAALLVVVDDDVDELLPPPPHAAAISATPTEKVAAVANHFHRCLRFKSLTSPGSILVAASASYRLRARCILT
jgi:hypothetical protein